MSTKGNIFTHSSTVGMYSMYSSKYADMHTAVCMYVRYVRMYSIAWVCLSDPGMAWANHHMRGTDKRFPVLQDLLLILIKIIFSCTVQ